MQRTVSIVPGPGPSPQPIPAPESLQAKSRIPAIPIAVAATLFVLAGAAWLLSQESDDPVTPVPVPTALIKPEAAGFDNQTDRQAMLDELHRQQTAAAVPAAATAAPPTQPVQMAEPVPPTQPVQIAEPAPPTEAPAPPPTRRPKPRPTKPPAVAAAKKPTPKIEIIYKGTTRTD